MEESLGVAQLFPQANAHLFILGNNQGLRPRPDLDLGCLCRRAKEKRKEVVKERKCIVDAWAATCIDRGLGSDADLLGSVPVDHAVGEDGRAEGLLLGGRRQVNTGVPRISELFKCCSLIDYRLVEGHVIRRIPFALPVSL